MNATNQLLGEQLLDILRRDRARRSRWRRFVSFLGKLSTALLTGFLTALLGGWMFMLAVGVMHDHWTPTLPTIGYWWSVLIVWLVRGTLTRTSPSSAKSERAS